MYGQQNVKIPSVEFTLPARQIRRHILQFHFSETDEFIYLIKVLTGTRYCLNERPLHNGHSSYDKFVIKGK